MARNVKRVSNKPLNDTVEWIVDWIFGMLILFLVSCAVWLLSAALGMMI